MPAECQGRASNQGGSEDPAARNIMSSSHRGTARRRQKSQAPPISLVSFPLSFFTCIFSLFRGQQPIKRHRDHLLTRCRDGMPRLGAERPPMMDLTAAWFFTCALRVSESTRRRYQRDVGCGLASRGCDTIGWREQAIMV